MKNRYAPSLLAASTLILLLVGASAPPAAADHSWSNYHWGRTTGAFSLRLASNVSSRWSPHLETARADWTTSDITMATAAGRAPSRKCPSTSGRVEVCNYRYGQNGWLGLAQIWITGSHITQGQVKLNDTYFDKAKYNTEAWRNHVMCQEVGHTLGLDHQDESGASLGTCMDYANDPSDSQHPNPHDYAQLEEIYTHLDSTNTVGAPTTSPSASNADLNRQDQWGRAIRTSPSDGRPILFERDFGGGRRMFTFVIWAEP